MSSKYLRYFATKADLKFVTRNVKLLLAVELPKTEIIPWNKIISRTWDLQSQLTWHYMYYCWQSFTWLHEYGSAFPSRLADCICILQMMQCENAHKMFCHWICMWKIRALALLDAVFFFLALYPPRSLFSSVSVARCRNKYTILTRTFGGTWAWRAKMSKTIPIQWKWIYIYIHEIFVFRDKRRESKTKYCIIRAHTHRPWMDETANGERTTY